MIRMENATNLGEWYLVHSLMPFFPSCPPHGAPLSSISVRILSTLQGIMRAWASNPSDDQKPDSSRTNF